MTKEEFRKFTAANQEELPLYFRDFEFHETLGSAAERKILQKKYSSDSYHTDKCRTEKPYKPILRVDL